MSATSPERAGAWRFDHFNIVTSPDRQVLGFFRDVMGLSSGARPPFPVPGDWLYDDTGLAVVHTVDDARIGPAPCARLAHLAFRTDEPAEHVRTRVVASGLPHTAAVVPEEGTIQIFVHLPGGLVIELDCPA
jgi:catechol 2,3-dioxygenase-like lactoylglutathione lyase family enzyme